MDDRRFCGVLGVSLFLPWYSAGGFYLNRSVGKIASETDLDFTAWEIFSVVDILLMGLVVLAILAVLRTADPRSISDGPLDTPAGLVIARVAVTDGHADSVTIENVPSYVERLDAVVDVPGLGRVPYSLAFGGNFYAMVDLDDVGLPFDRARQHDIVQAGLAIMEAINATAPPHHPTIDGVDHCHHVEFIAPGSTAEFSRHAMAIYPGWFDRSPCGTGTSARMAELWARGELPLDQDFVNESFIGSRFVGRLVAETEVGGKPAVVPTITGRAWVTGTAQYTLDPSDPFPSGFQF